MGVFIQPPFWAQAYRGSVSEHAVSVRVAGAAPTEPLDLAKAKAYARLGSNADLDAILPTVLTSCRLKVEQDTGIVLVPTTFDLFFDGVPRDGSPIRLPWRPVTAVSSVKYYDTATPSVLQTLGVSNYLLDPGSEIPVAPRLGLTIAGAWPTDLRPFQPYVIRIVAGYATAADVPAPLLHAIGLLVDAYVNKLSLEAYEDTIHGYQLVTVA